MACSALPTDAQNKADPSKGLHIGGSIINVASFVAILGAATPQLACELRSSPSTVCTGCPPSTDLMIHSARS